ncbi:MAG: hypothetical protein ABI629_12470 [bacterium]
MTLLAALVAASLVRAPVARAQTFPAPDPMSLWGYWTGVWEGQIDGGVEFLASQRAATYGANSISFHVDTTDAGLVAMRGAVEDAREQGVGVVLNWSGVLGKQPPEWALAGFDQVDYNRWQVAMSRVASALSGVVDGVVAMSGFDDMNGKRLVYGAFKPKTGAADPVQESMRLLALNFPTVKYRGHIWRIKDWATSTSKDPALLAGSTMLFPYSYQRGNADNATGTPFCPHEGSFPGNTLPEGSNARKTVDDIRGFVDWVDAAPGMAGVPMMFIPSSTHIGNGVAPGLDRGIGCTIETLWYHARCQALPSGEKWAGRLSGFLPFNYNSNHVDPTWFWTGVDHSPQLDQSGRWVGANRTCDFASQADFRKDPAQGYKSWHYETCTTNGALGVVKGCKEMTTYDTTIRDGVWRGTKVDATVWDTGESPPANDGKVTSRTWIAPAAGSVHISGKVVKAAPAQPCTAVDDGAAFAVFAGINDRIWPATGGWRIVVGGVPTETYEVDVEVEAGTPIQFVVHKNGADSSCDAVRATADIAYTW